MRNHTVRTAWVSAGLWVCVIAVESFFGSGAHTGSILRPLLESIFGPLSDPTFRTIHFLVRKCGHFSGYAILSLLFYRACWATLIARCDTAQLRWRDMRARWLWRPAVLALLATLAVAGLDEFHQSYDDTRGASVKDVALDESGALALQALLLAISTPGREGAVSDAALPKASKSA